MHWLQASEIYCETFFYSQNPIGIATQTKEWIKQQPPISCLPLLNEGFYVLQFRFSPHPKGFSDVPFCQKHTRVLGVFTIRRVVLNKADNFFGKTPTFFDLYRRSEILKNIQLPFTPILNARPPPILSEVELIDGRVQRDR